MAQWIFAVLMGLLSKRGHDLTVVGNGQEALEALEREPFDLLLLDVQMPVMGGIEATAAIRARELTAGVRTRIVAMTAHAMSGDRERAITHLERAVALWGTCDAELRPAVDDAERRMDELRGAATRS